MPGTEDEGAVADDRDGLAAQIRAAVGIPATGDSFDPKVRSPPLSPGSASRPTKRAA